MIQLLYAAEEVAAKRNAKLIGIEDFLFLLRKNKNRLHRLLRFLDFKDLKAMATKSIGIEDDESLLDDGKPLQSKKRRKACHDFLSAIDHTGEILALMDETEDDEFKKERNLRAEMLTRNMSHQQYLEFCEARQASFAPRYKMQKFKDWILSGASLEIKPNAFALEVLSYFAYETVAEIVDMALIVKRDKNVALFDPFSCQTAPVFANYDSNMSSKPADQSSPLLASPGGATSNSSLSSSSLNPTSNVFMSTQTPNPVVTGNANSLSNAVSSNILSKSKKKKTISQQSKDMIASQAITQSDIYEAVRRFCQPIGPFADFSKLPLIAMRQRFLCC